MPVYEVVCEKPVAIDSPDHRHPLGTAVDNSRNELFNRKAYALFPGRAIRVLDLGCSGGGFVKDCLDHGHQAVGIEGSDYSKTHRRAEWATIPGNLFTGDITAPITIRETDAEGSRPARFDLVTAWEVIEHIREEHIAAVVANIDRHLAPGGVCVMSISDEHEIVDGQDYHFTVQPREWWLRKFESLGLVHRDSVEDFFDQDLIRGPLQGAKSFPLFLTRTSEPPPPVPERFHFHPQLLFDCGRKYAEFGSKQTNHLNAFLGYGFLLLREASNLLPRDANIHYALAQVEWYIGRVEEARASVKWALELDPHHAEARQFWNKLRDLRARVKETLAARLAASSG